MEESINRDKYQSQQYYSRSISALSSPFQSATGALVIYINELGFAYLIIEYTECNK